MFLLACRLNNWTFFTKKKLTGRENLLFFSLAHSLNHSRSLFVCRGCFYVAQATFVIWRIISYTNIVEKIKVLMIVKFVLFVWTRVAFNVFPCFRADGSLLKLTQTHARNTQTIYLPGLIINRFMGITFFLFYGERTHRMWLAWVWFFGIEGQMRRWRHASSSSYQTVYGRANKSQTSKQCFFSW